MFRPLSRSHHQGDRNPWELQSHCIDLLECCYVYVFTSRCDSCGMLKHWSNRSIQWLCNSQGFWSPWWWLRLRGRNMLEWLTSNKLSGINLCISLVYFCLHLEFYWRYTSSNINVGHQLPWLTNFVVLTLNNSTSGKSHLVLILLTVLRF